MTFIDHVFMSACVILFTFHYLVCISCLEKQQFGKAENNATGRVWISKAPGDQLTVDKSWTSDAMSKMWKERKRMGMTNIHQFEPPGFPGTKILFKNESASPTGSLKHRYAWALMTWALLEQKVKNGTHVFEASSGNTACSLAYMCKLLGLEFTAIVPDTLEAVKIMRITREGGAVVRVPISERLKKASQMAEEEGDRGFFMNQFKNAFYAEEFHESGNYEFQSANMLHEILSQTDRIPDYFIHSAGTGGTISSIGRYAKKYGLTTQIVLADTEFSVYYDYVLNGRFVNESGANQWIKPGMAGIGYGTMGKAKIAETTSLDPAVIDRVLKIPDLASTAAMKVAYEYGIRGGTSTGVNILSALHIAAVSRNSNITIVTILADSADYYLESYLNRSWISSHFQFHGGLEVYDCWVEVIRNAVEKGTDPLDQEVCKNDNNDFKNK